MFVYLSKKIAIPHQLALQVVSWNSAQGWIACGGESGLLKVLKLESSEGGKAAAGQSNLSMNQTLEGHQGTIMVITWNENFRKLTTSDQNGLIIVWMLHRGIWFEEMINNRNRSVVRDMKWSADCQKICIIYEDGAVIVGTVDGQRLWGKEVKTQLAFVEWSPDGKNILFCTLNGEVHVYDNEGIYSHKVPIYCLDSGTEGTVAIAGIDWFAGPSGPDNQTPTLCLGFENGRVQIMRSDADDKPVLLDTQLRCTGLKWDPNGSVVAIAGIQAQGATNEREVGVVQFYAPSGQHLRSLRVPGQNLRAISWEGSGLRLALAVDSHIFFANIRPDYLWGYFSHTLVYAVLRKERNEHVVIFWDTHTDEKYTKYIKHVTHIRSSEEYCVLVTKADDASGQHIVIVCNDIGSPVDSKYMQLEPMHVAMTNSHVIATSEDVVYIWNYRSSVSRQAQGDLASAAAGMKQRRAEMMFHIDESFAPGSGTHDKEGFVPPSTTTQDPIACICATEQCLLVARESGIVQRYALPHLALEARFTIRCRPQVIAANCESTRMSVIDINGVWNSSFQLASTRRGVAVDCRIRSRPPLCFLLAGWYGPPASRRLCLLFLYYSCLPVEPPLFLRSACIYTNICIIVYYIKYTLYIYKQYIIKLVVSELLPMHTEFSKEDHYIVMAVCQLLLRFFCSLTSRSDVSLVFTFGLTLAREASRVSLKTVLS
ncbi:WD repeat-containing protein 35 (Naofen) [Durusdinium trenchii]|uniref:WD repeat-containing protein 35 (Naofen) n=1 Tax=Durusdinium trenchii TaxID=1381693 RepID=A0ABP0K9N6_9DINO